MKATVDRKALVAALKIVTPAVGTARHLPVLGGVRIDASKQGLRLCCSDLDLTIATHLATEVEEIGVAIPPAKILAGFLAAGAGSDVDLEVDGSHLIATCGEATVRLRCFDAEQWPQIEDLDGEGTHLDGDAVRRLARIIHCAASDNAERPILRAIHFTGGEAWATDGNRAARADLGDVSMPTADIPAASITAALRAIGDEGCTVRVSHRLASIEAGNTVWTTTLIFGGSGHPYPDMGKFVRPTSPHELTFDLVALEGALGRMKTIGGDGDVRRVTFTRDGDKYVLSAVTADVGEISDVVPVSGDFDQQFGLNLPLLVPLLANHVGTEITLGIEDARKPMQAASDGVVQVLMPVRPE